MNNVSDAQLAAMSVKELTQLHAEILSAVRAAIRAKSAKMAWPAKIVAQPATVGLEQERDTWLAKRKGTYA